MATYLVTYSGSFEVEADTDEEANDYIPSNADYWNVEKIDDDKY